MTTKKAWPIRRLIGIICLLLVQMVFFTILAIYMLGKYPWLTYIGAIISLYAFFTLIKKHQPAAYKLLWVIVVLALFPIGSLLYFLYSNRPTSKQIRQFQKTHLYFDSSKRKKEKKSRVESLFQYVKNASQALAYPNTDMTYYPSGEAMFAPILKALKDAKHFIFLEFFIISDGHFWQSILTILQEKATVGVDVRLLVDDFGSMAFFKPAYVRRLAQDGIKVVRFNPVKPWLFSIMNHRDHRKIIIVDNDIAFTGGFNLADEYINIKTRFGYWKDNGLRIQGAAVSAFTTMFLQMWTMFDSSSVAPPKQVSAPKITVPSLADNIVIPFGDHPLDEMQTAEAIYIDMLHQACDYVYIYTPYLILSERLFDALKMTARRGVDVRIITPGTPDKKLVYRLTRANYAPLLAAGVRIFEYTPGFMHAKTFLSDDRLAVVGTINLDFRSLYLHFECGVLIYNHAVLDDIKKDICESFASSKEIVHADWQSGILRHLIDALLHLFAPLL